MRTEYQKFISWKQIHHMNKQSNQSYVGSKPKMQEDFSMGKPPWMISPKCDQTISQEFVKMKMLAW